MSSSDTDTANQNASHAIDALVASGDCFVTLATQLDALEHNTSVESVVRVLIYLQRHYAIVKKQPNYRQ